MRPPSSRAARLAASSATAATSRPARPLARPKLQPDSVWPSPSARHVADAQQSVRENSTDPPSMAVDAIATRDLASPYPTDSTFRTSGRRDVASRSSSRATATFRSVVTVACASSNRPAIGSAGPIRTSTLPGSGSANRAPSRATRTSSATSAGSGSAAYAYPSRSSTITRTPTPRLSEKDSDSTSPARARTWTWVSSWAKASTASPPAASAIATAHSSGRSGRPDPAGRSRIGPSHRHAGDADRGAPRPDRHALTLLPAHPVPRLEVRGHRVDRRQDGRPVADQVGPAHG